MMKADAPGLYIHIPFCRSKCPYCDFYSFTADEKTKDEYTAAIIKNIIIWQEKTKNGFSSIYFGGGTPSQLGSSRLAEIVKTIKKQPLCEVTVECNPFDLSEGWSYSDIALLKSAGVNRISMGMQSAIDKERKTLGRRAGRAEIEKAVRMIKDGGIDNFSLDLMLGIPFQTTDSIKESIAFCAESGAKHVSSYLLKIEQGTPFEKVEKLLDLPDEDECCDMYLAACEELEKHGYRQYEISNFAKDGYESRHNLIYWDCREYLGIGAAAHSFFGGKRFYFPSDAAAFINGAKPVDDGEGGSFEEYVMLRLRLTEGLTNEGCKSRFGFEIPTKMVDKSTVFEKNGLLISDRKGIRLTPEGFLVSNSIIAELLD